MKLINFLKNTVAKYKRSSDLIICLLLGYLFYLNFGWMLNSSTHGSLILMLTFGVIFSISFCLSLLYFIGFCRNIHPLYLITHDFSDILFSYQKDDDNYEQNAQTTYHEETKQSDESIEISSFDELKGYLKILFNNSTDIISNLEKLRVAKKNMTGLIDKQVNNTHNIEIKLFLDKDIEQMIDSLRDEAHILCQMKMNHHPQLETQKKEFLESMVERISLIGQKMIEENEKINDDMTDALKEKRNVNLAFLKSKM